MSEIKMVTCQWCSGVGHRECCQCDGKGHITPYTYRNDNRETCPNCNGTGRTSCIQCYGSGKVEGK